MIGPVDALCNNDDLRFDAWNAESVMPELPTQAYPSTELDATGALPENATPPIPSTDADRQDSSAPTRDAGGSTLPAGGATGAATPSSQRYTIIRAHARGGLGQVSVARDEALRRQVALKEIRPDRADDPHLRQRFLTEAEITGQLEHPGIVPIYALDRDEQGRPYYAMRFIAGRTLGEAIHAFHKSSKGAENRASFASLDFRDLLKRFIDVCEAIAYAHSRGVIHRDLKPANVMLGEFGETLVLDWGLAKVLGRENEPSPSDSHVRIVPSDAGAESSLGMHTSSLTEAGQVLGTPAYMSPEQAAGAGVGLATDGYALGAMLYEVLTGRPPFTGRTSLEVLEKLRAGPPRLPSEIQRQVPRGLEAICIRGMARSAVERYATASDLAREVERWLADEPVQAFSEPWSLRMRRWARRHRTLVVSAMAVTVAGVLLLAAAAWQLNAKNEDLAASNQRESEAKERAEQSYLAARQALEEVMTLKEDPRFRRGKLEDVRRKLLQAEAAFYEKFIKLRSDDPGFRAEQASALDRLARVTDEMGSREDALRHVQHALALWQQLADAEPDVAEHQAGLAASQRFLGHLHRIVARTAEAETALKIAKAAYERLVELRPESTEYRQALAFVLEDLGQLYDGVGRHRESEEAFLAALDVSKKLAHEHPQAAEYQSNLGGLAINYGKMCINLRQFEPAEQSLEFARITNEALLRVYPNEPKYAEDLAHARYQLGLARAGVLRWPQAEADFRTALRIREKLAEDHPLRTDYQTNLAASDQQIGWVCIHTGRRAEGLAAYMKAFSRLDRLVKEHPAVAAYALDLAMLCINIARVEGIAADWEKAMSWYDRALELTQRVLKNEPRHTEGLWTLQTLYGNRAPIWNMMGRPVECILDYNRAQAMNSGQPLEGTEAFRTLFHAAFRRQLCDQLRKGETEKALTGANAVLQLPLVPGDTCLALAAVFAVASTVAKDSDDKEKWAARAVGLLESARVAGFFADVKQQEQLQKDEDFAPLRNRADYQRIVAKLGSALP
jgi:serine/threonine-protein kinase